MFSPWPNFIDTDFMHTRVIAVTEGTFRNDGVIFISENIENHVQNDMMTYRNPVFLNQRAFCILFHQIRIRLYS
jgi:hypothetical protein